MYSKVNWVTVNDIRFRFDEVLKKKLKIIGLVLILFKD